MDKLKSIFKSLDLWILVTGWLAQYVASLQMTGFTMTGLLTQVFYLLSGILALGKVNTVIQNYQNTKIGSTKSSVTSSGFTL